MGDMLRDSIGMAKLDTASSTVAEDENPPPAPAFWDKVLKLEALLIEKKKDGQTEMELVTSSMGNRNRADEVKGEIAEKGSDGISRIGAIKRLVIGAVRLDLDCLPTDCGSLHPDIRKIDSRKCKWTETEKKIIADFCENKSTGCYNKHVECGNVIIGDKDLRVHFHPTHLKSSASLRQGARQWQMDKAKGLAYTMQQMSDLV